MAGLEGVQVVQVGGGDAAALAGVLLADQGADVVVVRSPSDLPVRWAGYDRGKTVVTGDPAALVAKADVVIDGTPDGLPMPRPPATVWCRLHGGGGPPIEELVAARTGLYEPPVGLRPRFHDVPAVTTTAAAWAVNGVVAALLARRRDGRGQSVRVSLYDAAVSTQELLAFFTDRPSRAFQPLQWVASPFVALHPCRSGHLFVHLGLPHHLRAFLDALGAEGADLAGVLSAETLADPGSLGGVREAVRATAALRRVLATADAEAWEARFPDLCLAAVRDVGTWMSSPMAAEGGHVVTTVDGPMPGPATDTVGSRVQPVRTGSIDEVAGRWRTQPEPTGDDRRPPLAGIRVLDFTMVIAGPVAGRTLAELGAEVVRVDDPWLHPAWVDGFHALFDRGKASVWLDLQTRAGRVALEDLVARLQPDVVLQNFRPGVADRLGLLDLAPHRVSLSAFGAHGPWAGRPGWEQTVQAACGMEAAYGGPGSPELFPVPIHDLLTGLFGAYGALVALYGGGDAEASLARTSTWLQAAAALGGVPAVDGWVKDDGWTFVAHGERVPRASQAGARAACPLVRRETREDLGSFTRIDSPLALSRTAVTEGASRPRGWATKAWTGVEREGPGPHLVGRRRWWLARARWLVGVGLVRGVFR
ncbi:MAG: CoA transferase [Alphaproteobacteria bacterium]|nr:CoA transferase [Alphaproteobacteria bacterium]